MLSARHVELARKAGALTELPLALASRAYFLLYAGDLTAAAALADEAQVITDATGSNLADYGRLGLGAFRGDETGTRALITATLQDADERGEGKGTALAEWANAVLDNSLGHSQNALAAAQRASAYEEDPGATIWPTVELIEAAARSGRNELATTGYHDLRK